MAGDPDVIGRIKKSHLGDFVVHQPGVGGFLASIPRQNAVRAENEEISFSRDRRPAVPCRNLVGRVGSVVGEIQQDRIHVARLETGDAELKPDLGQSDLQFLKLDGQQLAVPSGLFCKSVVGQHVSADFFLAEVRKSDDRKAFETEKLGGGKSPMTCDDPALIVDNQGIDHAEPQHRVGDLPNLLLGVGAGVPPRKAQPTETHHLNWSRIGGGFFARVRNLSTGFKLRSFGFSGAHS